jgi:hypothetical protein
MHDGNGVMWRFFYHYNKPHKCMSVHFRDTCYMVHDIQCQVPCETKWSDTQPHLKMVGWAHQVEIVGDMARIS